MTGTNFLSFQVGWPVVLGAAAVLARVVTENSAETPSPTDHQPS